MVPALDVIDLTKTYQRRRADDVHAAREVTFTAPEAAITAVLGPNGAGKSTTLECCSGLRRADSGRAVVLGRERRNPADDQWLRERVGVMVQSGGLPMAPTGREVLRHRSRFYSPRADLDHLAGALALDDALDTQVRRLSGGQKQRLAVACALVGKPQLAFLDEPTSGVDPHARRICWKLLREERAAGTSVVLTTHHIDEAQALADRVVIMARGRVVAEGTVGDLAHGYRLRVTGTESGRIAQVLERVSPASVNGEAFVEWSDARTLGHLMQALVDAGAPEAKVELSPRTLESVYLELTREEAES